MFKQTKLRSCIDISKLNWPNLCTNINATELIKQNLDKADWYWLSGNPNAVEILEQNLDRVNWSSLSYNPNAVHILEQYPNKIDWNVIPRNRNAIHIIEANLDKIKWYNLLANESAMHIIEANIHKFRYCEELSINFNAVKFLKQYPNLIDWYFLGYNQNPEAIQIMRDNMDKVVFESLSSNEAPEAVQLLNENKENIVWTTMSGNASAIAIMEETPDLIDMEYLFTNAGAFHLIEPMLDSMDALQWADLSTNPAIFTYDYDLIKKTNAEKNNCVNEWFNQPRFIAKFIQEHGMDAIDTYEASYKA